MSTNRIVILTGSTGGLGKAMAQRIIARHEAITLLATSRRGVDLKLQPANPASLIAYPKLDVTDDGSIHRLVAHINKAYNGHVDVVISNGGGSPYEEYDISTFGRNAVDKTLDLNFYSTIRLRKAFAPLMTPGGRFVYVSSTAAYQVTFGNGGLHHRAFDSKIDEAGLSQLADDYTRAAENPQPDDGWLRDGFKPAYSTSKALVNLLAAADARAYPELVFNAACPGICDTGEIPREALANAEQMWKLKSPAEGARLPLRLAFDDLQGINGKFWAGESTGDVGPGVVVADWPGKKIVWDYVG